MTISIRSIKQEISNKKFPREIQVQSIANQVIFVSIVCIVLSASTKKFSDYKKGRRIVKFAVR